GLGLSLCRLSNLSLFFSLASFNLYFACSISSGLLSNCLMRNARSSLLISSSHGNAFHVDKWLFDTYSNTHFDVCSSHMDPCFDSHKVDTNRETIDHDVVRLDLQQTLNAT
ncbi:hypothetical protein GOP47_0018236, partial [Adiantum capillus-veneris]